MIVVLGGDVMTGRGVDQILPNPGDSRLWESQISDARAYVSLVETKSGPIPRPITYSWPWGDALQAVEEIGPAARLINLETSITTSSDAAPGKEVHYRMSPDNLGCLTSFRPDVCVLANNHVLDFGQAGLLDTLAALKAAGLHTAGAGADRREAYEPAITSTSEGGRIVVVAVGAPSSGIPVSWAATPDTSGVAFLEDLSDTTADQISERACEPKRQGDVTVVSIHWGSNWGYDVPAAHVRFAHQLVDRGVDLIYGHSSHHPRPIEVYRGKLILYGCGDLIDDYEGITGYEEFRDDLRLLYFASLDADTGRLIHLSMTPMQSRRMRLQYASANDARWLRQVIEEASRPFATRIDIGDAGSLTLRTA